MTLYPEITREEIAAEFEKTFGVTPSDGSAEQWYCVLSGTIAERLKDRLAKTEEKQRGAKKVCYLSMEFLVGKNLKYAAASTGLLSNIEELLLTESQALKTQSYRITSLPMREPVFHSVIMTRMR